MEIRNLRGNKIMSLHFTYSELDSGSDLEQGDLLEITDALVALFRDVHPYYVNGKYIAFIIVTQSCDLVRRQGKCKTKYINIAAIRTMDGVLQSLLTDECSPVCKGVYIEESRSRFRMMLERILNQNEQSYGVFYLHPTDDVGVYEPALAMLRVCISVKQEHYDILLNSRRGRLNPEFRNKLGWMVGNLYSRVGTPDWPDLDMKKLVDEYIKVEVDGEEIEWVPRKLVDRVHKAGVKMEALGRQEMRDVIEQHMPPDPLIEALGRVQKTIKDVFKDKDQAGIKKYCKSLTE